MSFNSTSLELIEQNINGLLNAHSSWERVPLEDIVSLKNGFAFKSSHFNHDGKGHRLIRIRDVTKGDTKTFYTGEVPDGFWIEQGDLILGMDGDFNITLWPSSPALLNQRVCKVVVINDNSYSDRFLYHTLPGYLEAINHNTSSTTVKHLSTRSLGKIDFPLPPLAEQTVIAQTLDTLLAQVDNIKTRLDAIPNILKTFRQSVLAAAVSGKLTEAWRGENDYIDITQHYSAPSVWRAVNINAVIEYVTSGSRGWAAYYADEGSLFIRSQDINTDELDIVDAAYVALPEKAEGRRTKVKKEDLLVTITGANVTKCARVKVELNDAYISQHVALIRLKDSISANFIELVLKAGNAGRKQLTDMAYGGGKPGLNLQNIKDVEFSLPSAEEQTQIVSRVEELFAFADQIDQQVKNAQGRVNNLTQSILAKAFRGELTAQWRAEHPDLITGDNSAEALLAKIQEERLKIKESAKAKKKSTAKKTTRKKAAAK